MVHQMAENKSPLRGAATADPATARLVARDATLELARIAAAGDVVATRRLLDLVAPRVVRVVRAVMGAAHPDVDDAAQLPLIGFIQALPSFRGECDPTNFAARIAMRTAASARRRANARRSHRDDSTDLDAVEAPHNQLLASERRSLIRTLLDQLPEEQAEALGLRTILGWSLKEIATTTGAPLNTVRSRLRSAKETLRQRIAENRVVAEVVDEALTGQ
jgi:RNA polymerase sigma-70 factor (ECF subfamily)